MKTFLSRPFQESLPFDSPVVPFACFGAITIANVLLSYFRFSTTIVLWIILLGLVVPLFLAANLPEAEKSAALLFKIPPWAWVAVLFLSFFLRLIQLTKLSGWPIVDEGVFGYFATLLEQKWTWQLTHGYAQEPILYTWGQFLFFKLFGNSLFSLWFFPACCSLLALPLAFLAVRKVNGSSMGFMILGLTGLSFWPLYLGRVSVQSALMVPWEWMVLLVLAYALSPKKASRLPSLLLLSVLTALGFYLYLAWPLVAFMVLLAVLFQAEIDWKTRLGNLTLFLLIHAALLFPLVMDYLRDNHNYLGHLWSPAIHSSLVEKIPLPWNYLSALFWGANSSAFSHGPLWGGLFNPLLTACFLWGLVDLVRFPRRPLDLWILLSLFVFFLPAFLTNNFEMMRLTALLPPIVLICALGARNLLTILPQNRRMVGFLFLLACSCLLDSHQLFQVYGGVWERTPGYFKAHKTTEFFRANPLLEDIHRKEGPGLILLNFNPDPYDQTLFVSSYAYNAAENPSLNPAFAKWAAILANTHEQPALKRLFPDGQWVWLSEGLGRSDGGFLLEIIALTPKNQPTLDRWTKADLALNELTYQVMENGVDPVQGPMLRVLDQAYPLFRGDLLLESRYWRIRALHDLAGGDRPVAIQDYRYALSKGLPQAELYDELGKLEWKAGNAKEAEGAFQGALACRPNLTDAALNLQALENLNEIH